ncbi:MAG: hypothetical protein GY719_22425 [bacterium]|nr:hypothetical protein [bacterium]
MREEIPKHLKVYLTSWQKRMVREFTSEALLPDGGREVAVMDMEYKKGKCHASYKIPAQGIRLNDWVLPLTDEQMYQVSAETGVREDFSMVNVTEKDLETGAVKFYM